MTASTSARPGPIGEREGRWADLWATYPPMSRRIAAFKAMAYQA